MKKNIAVIGCGHWGKNLIRNFSECGSLYAVCDPEKNLALKYAEQYGVKILTFSEVVSDSNVKGVVLAVPAPLHAQLAIKAINCKKHVYIEKPLAMNLEEANDIVKQANKNNVKVMVGHLLQYHPIFIKLKNLIHSGYIGDLSYIYSNRLSVGKIRSDEDVIWSFAPHDISMILSLVMQRPKSIRAETATILQNNISDKAILHMEFENDINTHIFVSWLHPFKEHKLVINGNKGMAVFDDTKPWDQKLAIYKHKISISNKNPEIEKEDPEFIHVHQSEPLKNECLHFIDVVNNLIEPKTNAYEGTRVLEILTSASLSDELNETVIF